MSNSLLRGAGGRAQGVVAGSFCRPRNVVRSRGTPPWAKRRCRLNTMESEHRKQSYAIWQELARPWESGRDIIGGASRRVTEWLVDRLAPTRGQTIVELAAGTGETGLRAARQLGDGRLISSDFAPLLGEAARRVAAQLGLHNVDFRVLDAEALDLGTASVDGAICRFGYMLMGNPAQALRETRRVLRPGGRLVLSVWGDPQRNPWAAVPASAMVALGHMPPRDPD